jgi:threonine aldolase
MKSSAKEMISGFDVISLGLSKTGGMVSEAVITNDPIVKEKLMYGRKASTQLMSKLRYMSAQFNALLENDLWLENAQQANEMALYLFEKLEGLPKIEIIRKPEANAVFLKVDSKKIEQIADELGFYIWDRESNLVRFMTSWCSTREGVDSFVEELSKAIKN